MHNYTGVYVVYNVLSTFYYAVLFVFLDIATHNSEKYSVHHIVNYNM